MSLWHCKDCTTAYSVGAERCPHCGSTEYQTLPVQRAYVCEGCETAYRVPLSSCPRCRGTSFKETSMAKITKAAGATNADLGEVTLEEPAVETRPVHEPVVTPDTEPAEDAAPNVEAPDDEEPGTEADDVEQGEQQEPDADQDAAPDYSTWLVADLREELGKRKLSTEGLKAELVERLTDDDAIRV